MIEIILVLALVAGVVGFLAERKTAQEYRDPQPRSARVVATTTYRQSRKTSHAAHLLGTIVTCGLWAPMWLFAGMHATFRPGRKVTEKHHDV